MNVHLHLLANKICLSEIEPGDWTVVCLVKITLGLTQNVSPTSRKPNGPPFSMEETKDIFEGMDWWLPYVGIEVAYYSSVFLFYCHNLSVGGDVTCLWLFILCKRWLIFEMHLFSIILCFLPHFFKCCALGCLDPNSEITLGRSLRKNRLFLRTGVDKPQWNQSAASRTNWWGYFELVLGIPFEEKTVFPFCCHFVITAHRNASPTFVERNIGYVVAWLSVIVWFRPN